MQRNAVWEKAEGPYKRNVYLRFFNCRELLADSDGSYHAAYSYKERILDTDTCGRERKTGELGRRNCSIMKSQ